ncbi:MAG: S41 family peptidase [Bacillota bacterium]
MFTTKNKKLLIGVTILVLTIITSVGFFMHHTYANSNRFSEQETSSKFQKLFVIFDIIEQSYVEDEEMDTLVTGAIDGMLNSLEDPYTNYLPPKEYEGMKEDFEGKYGGIGIMITLRDGQITVISPFKGTPGAKAGLKAGDIISKIEGHKTKGMKLEQAVDMMRGKPGTKVKLNIKRGTNKNIIDPEEQSYKKIEVDITRAEIEVPYLTSELKEGNVGYIELTRFIEDSGQKVASAIEDLNKQGAQGFVLDLRNNPGGLLQEAAKVANNFVDQGPVVYVEERGKEKQAIPLAGEFETTDKPLVVLINGGSASAAEIVTGAIQDQERGTIVGEKTFGKGVVQSLVPLTDGSAVKLTTARYYTPDGQFIHHQGIEPDVKVALTDTPDNSNLIKTENAQKVLKAMDYYSGALDGVYGPKTARAVLRFQYDNDLEATGVIDSSTEEKLAQISSRKDIQEEIESEDKQLNEALEILKQKFN